MTRRKQRQMTQLELWAMTENYPFTEKTLTRLEDAIEHIVIPEVQQFVVFGVMKCSNEIKLQDALDQFDMLKDFLTKRGGYNEFSPSKQNDCVFAAMLLHNIWYDQRADKPEDDGIKVFAARQRMMDLAKEFVVMSPACRDGVFDYIFQMIEAQLGGEMPVQNCRPMTGQMSYCLWEILWLYYTYVSTNDDEKNIYRYCPQDSDWKIEV